MSMHTKTRSWRLRHKVLIAVSGCLALAAVAAPSASADLEFEHVGINLTETPTLNTETFEYPKAGPFSRQAGAHPDLSFSFALPLSGSIEAEGHPSPGPPEAVHEVDIDLPPGLVGNPTGIATCTPSQLTNRTFGASICPLASQVGVVDVTTNTASGPIPVFNIAHSPEVPALFGFNFSGAVSFIGARVRPGDYGISSGSDGISQGLAVEAAKVTLWGVPADPSHDLQRAEGGSIQDFFPVSPEAPRVPFLTAPTSCSDSPAPFTVRGDSWEHRGIFDERTLTTDEDGTPFVFEGCERLPFGPTVDVRPLSRVADSPTGLNVDVSVPQSDDPDGVGTAHVRKIVTKFPAGVSVSPSSAAGLGACSPSQIALATIEAPTCPNSSKIAKVTIETPLLEESLEGDMILATPYDNPSNSLVAVYVAVKGPGFWIKLPGKVDLDPVTGQVTATFEETPQLPFSHLRVEFPGGPLASLATTPRCGTYSSQAEVTSWASSIPVALSSPMSFEEGCTQGPNAPSFTAGTTNPQAGQYAPFEFHLTRGDQTPYLAAISTTLPPGLLANIGSVAQCANGAAATGSCPASSEVGTTTVLSGPGSQPLSVKGHVYLTGPYKDAPYGLSIAVPTAGQAGPFDLGTVVVRAGVYVDPTDAHVTVKSDPLPTIIKGIPLRIRQVNVAINRPNFTLNPTNCAEKKVLGGFEALGAPTSNQAVKFTATGCDELGFKPSLKLSLKGQTKRAGNPALTAVLKAPAGDANIAKTAVLLPKTEFIDNRHINNPCTRVQFAANACPAKSILGMATAYTPLLNQPLTGPVYFRSNGGERRLPDLVADLNGPIHITLVGFIDSVGKKGSESSRVRTRFQNVPDAPVSKFELKLFGGKRGLIQNSVNLCKNPGQATVQLEGQNGKPHNFDTPFAAQCGGKKGKKK
jgi:hypothetical protein